MTALLLLLLLLLLLWLRQPVFVLLGVAAVLAYTVWGDGEARNLIYDVWNSSNSEVLVSIPLFILAGGIMSRGAIAARLVEVMRALARPIPGGLALATVQSCGIFAAISGSSVVTMLAVGSILYPALLQSGYDRKFALGALCAGGTLGIIIPPSIPLILYGIATDTSISDLFLAGFGPGLLLLSLFAIYAVWRNRHMPRERWDGAEIVTALRRGVFALAMPALILGGIYSGLFTVTEAAAVAVVYALAVELLVHREMSIADLRDVALDTAKLLGGLFVVLALALSLNMFLTYERVPAELAAVIQEHVQSKALFLVATNLLLLVVGCFMDVGSAILVLAPLLTPIAEGFGMSKVHFGIMMIVNLEIGYLTPPMGLNLIVATTAFREEFGTVCRAVLPWIGLMLLALVLVALFPVISLFALG